MKAFRSSLLAAAFLLTSPLESAPQVDAPAYREGDNWTVNWEFNTRGSRSDMLPRGVYDVFYRSGKFLWCPSKADMPFGTPCSDPWDGLREEDAVAFFGTYQKVPFLAFPMNVGDTRRYEYSRTVERRATQLEGRVTVTGMQLLKIGAIEVATYKHEMNEEGGGCFACL